MNKYGILLALGIVAGATSIGAQTHPDFAGTWVLIHEDDVRGEQLGALGEVFVATQSSANLMVDWHSTGPAGRGLPGKLVYRLVHSTFPFDGTQSNITSISSSGSVARIIDTAGWDDGKLVITTTWRGNIAANVTRKLSLSLEPSGMLIAETSRPTQAGEPWSTVRSQYRRLDRREASK